VLISIAACVACCSDALTPVEWSFARREQ